MNPIVEGSNSCEDFEWEDLCEELTHHMRTRNPSLSWTARVEGFGWRSIDGTMDVFRAESGRDLLLKILPNTVCSFKIYKHGRYGFKINNAHHDKPCGGEWYYIGRGTV